MMSMKVADLCVECDRECKVAVQAGQIVFCPKFKKVEGSVETSKK